MRDSTAQADPKVVVASSRKKKRKMSFIRLISHGDSIDKVLMLVGLVGAIGTGVSQPLLTLLFGDLVDAMNPLFPSSELIERTRTVSLKLVYTAIGVGVASVLSMGGWALTSERQADRIRRRYLSALLRQDVAFFDQEVGVGETINKISGDILIVQNALGDKVANVIEFSTRFLFGWGVGFYVNWKLTAIVIAAIPPIAVVGSLMAVSVSKFTNRSLDSTSKASGVVDQVLSCLRTVASNTGEERALKQYDDALKTAEKAGFMLGTIRGVGGGFLLLITFSTYAMAIYFGSLLVSRGEISAGEVLNVIFAVIMGGSALGMLPPYLTDIMAGIRASESMFEVIERKPGIDVEDLKGHTFLTVQGEIHFQNVEFAYPTRSQVEVLRGFDLLIKSGSTTALVGESGSGKSSVIQLIERFYDPQMGQVLLDGVNIRDLQLKWYRSQIALVSQEPVLFATTIRENIKYGKIDATLDEIEAACDLANASLFISRMPQGLDTLVGERGTQLSGGQKQRVAIARAILKNPRVLLLDEATSALDSESERVVQDALDRVRMDRTTLVVAHRLSTIKAADLIAVVQKGVVVESGVHGELLENVDGPYSQLVRLQETVAANQSVLASPFSRSGAYELHSEDGSFRRPSREPSSRQLTRRSTSYLGSSSRFSSMSDILSLGNMSSRTFDPVQVRDLLEEAPEEGGGKPDSGEVKVGFLRLARMSKPEFLNVVLGSVGSAIEGAIFPVFSLIFAKTVGGLTAESPAKVKENGRFYACMFIVLGATHFIFTPCEQINLAYAGERLLRRLKLLYFEKLLRHEAGWFDDDKNSSSKVSARLVSDAAAVKNVLGESLCLVVQCMSTVITGLAVAFTGSWHLTLIVIGLSPFLCLQVVLYPTVAKGLRQSDEIDLGEATQVATDAVGNIRTVASFGVEQKMVELYGRKAVGASSVNIKNGMSSGFIMGLANFSLFASYALSFYVGALLVRKGLLEAIDVFQVFFAIALSCLSLSVAMRKVPEMMNCKSALRSVFRVLDRPTKIDPLDTRGVCLQNLRGKIQFKAVNFAYPSRPHVQVLRDLTFTVNAGKSLALVGESGCGKSTVISLIERFYDPDSGYILVDGVEIQALKLKWLRHNLGLVSQEPVLFDESIRDNILYGKEGYTTEEEVHEAARYANAHSFISALPDGYNTRVGERGVQLSGGQKQRVAIARAILRSPRILLLDEATSALDAESERVVQDALDRIMVRRTSIIIAHRLSAVKHCDQICVLQAGRVVEKGTFHELVAAQGLFAALARQSSRKPQQKT